MLAALLPDDKSRPPSSVEPRINGGLGTGRDVSLMTAPLLPGSPACPQTALCLRDLQVMASLSVVAAPPMYLIDPLRAFDATGEIETKMMDRCGHQPGLMSNPPRYAHLCCVYKTAQRSIKASNTFLRCG
jgi:hypothetical protein